MLRSGNGRTVEILRDGRNGKFDRTPQQKAPKTKLQTPNNIQAPISKTGGTVACIIPMTEVHGWLHQKMEEGRGVDPKVYAALYFIHRES